MGPPASHGISRVPRYSSTRPSHATFGLRGSHPLWRRFPAASATYRGTRGGVVAPPDAASNPAAATATTLARQRFGLFPVRSPLLGESRLISTPRGTKMFQFPRFPLYPYGFRAECRGITPCALPHSDIPGSGPAGGSPRLIAAYHVLLRLLAPRHPPCALACAAPAPRGRATRRILRSSTGSVVVKVPNPAPPSRKRGARQSQSPFHRLRGRAATPTDQPRDSA